MNRFKECTKNNKTKEPSLHSNLSIFSILLIIIGLLPFFMIIITGSPGVDMLRYIFGKEIIEYIPRLDELIFYTGITLVCTALTHFYIRTDFARRIIFCEIFIVLLMYFADIIMIIPSGSGTFVEIIRNGISILLSISNLICFYIIYQYSKNIKISYLPSIVGALNTILFITANQLNIIIYKGFNTGFGIENFPRTVCIILFVNLMPSFLATIIIKITDDIRREKRNLV